MVRGDAAEIGALAGRQGLAIRSDPRAESVAQMLFTRRSGLAEVVIPPRSELIGQTVYPGMATSSGDLVILAVRRKAADLGPAATKLTVGDTLLLQGSWDALDVNLAGPGVLLVDSPRAVRRQAISMGAGGKRAVAVVTGMVVLLATGVVPPAVALTVSGAGEQVARVPVYWRF